MHEKIYTEKRCKEDACYMQVSHQHFLQVIAMNLFRQNSCRHQGIKMKRYAEMV